MINRRDLFRFRAYTDSFTGKYRMVYNVENTYDDGCNNVLMSGKCFGDIAECHKEHNLMLCTGIKDSNGKLIYENDVIEIEYIFNRKIKYQVKYGEYTHYLRPHTNIGFYMQSLEDNSTWSFEVAPSSTTIIGNIYETEEFMHLQGDNDLPSDAFMQSMIDNYSDNDEHSDRSIEKAYEQTEKEIQEMINNKPLYIRKSDKKNFVLIHTEYGKIQMKGITPEKEVVEKDIGSIKIYVLMCNDISKEIVVINKEQLQEEYEIVN